MSEHSRERVLVAAAQAFAAEGSAVSLDRIARLAGLGAGTVYRYFPSKDSLLEAVLTRRIDRLAGRAQWWSEAAAPGPAFFGYLAEVVESTGDQKDLCDAMQGDRTWPRAAYAASGRRFDQALSRLLRAAQRAGAVRGEVTTAEVSTLILGCSVMRHRFRDSGLVTRVLGTLAPAPGGAVTKPAAFRDHLVVPDPVCAVCGAPLQPGTTGRPARYCGAACRQRAHRRRATTPA
jgi:AcrR family transcriptional regulator